jgi:hypothetical protein
MLNQVQHDASVTFQTVFIIYRWLLETQLSSPLWMKDLHVTVIKEVVVNPPLIS